MLKHGRAGVPMEVMGLMLGEFIDDYTVQVVDVFAMPQSGTGVSVEAVDPVFQTRMLDMLKQTNRPQMVVGWYHSHPGFGCWLSGVDISCFPVHDHQILTERGFMLHQDVVAHFAQHDRLGVASYLDGRLVFSDITVNDVTYAEGKRNIVGFRDVRNNVDVLATDNHQMWVSAGRADAESGSPGAPKRDFGPPFRFYDAKELVALGRDDPTTNIRFSAQFEAGVAGVDDNGLSLPFAAALGLQSRAQVDAFLWLYGCWLSDGWLDGSDGCAYVMFGPKKAGDCDVLDQMLAAAGLRRLATAKVGQPGYWRAQQPNANGQTAFRICSASWWTLFAQQYGHKYSGAAQRAAAYAGAVRRGSGLARPRHADFWEGLTAEGETEPSSPQPQDAEDNDSAKVEARSRHSLAVHRSGRPPDNFAVVCAVCQWFWSWVYSSLSARQLRLILDGLCLADGHNADSSAYPLICTSSARFRDEVQRVALMAGYAADWEIDTEAGNKAALNGPDIASRSTGWKVRFHDSGRQAQPVIDASTLTVDQGVDGPVWCITVPAPHLIMVRRVLETEDGVVRVASRPLVVGNTQQSFEALNKRAVAVVVDPIQSVKGKVVIDAFRLINPQLMMMGGAHAPRQTTSNLGHLRKPSIQALIHNLNRHYYSINIAYAYRRNELEQKMLLNLHKRVWTAGLKVEAVREHRARNEAQLQEMLKLCKDWGRRLEEEEGKSEKELMVENVGKIDPKKHLQQKVEELMTANIAHTLGVMLDTIVF